MSDVRKHIFEYKQQASSSRNTYLAEVLAEEGYPWTLTHSVMWPALIFMEVQTFQNQRKGLNFKR